MKRTDQSLFEQMQISEMEIEQRKSLLGLNYQKLQKLTVLKDIIFLQIESIVEEFYNLQTSVDDIALLIGDADTLIRLKNAMRKYILDLFGGYYDSEYVNNRLRIGMVHKRIGVEPKLYLSAVNTLKEVILKHLKNTRPIDIDLKEIETILDKLFYFDITLVFDTYIRSLIFEIETARNKTELYAKGLEEKVAERTKQLEELSRKDPVTSLYNQRSLREYLYKYLSHAERKKECLSLLYFDVDNFKQINDTYGHQKGDEVLKAIANVLINISRDTDIPCRYGGDEFCLVLPDCDLKNAEMVAGKVIEYFTQKHPDISLSIGIATVDSDYYPEADELILKADHLMYLAKKETGSTCQGAKITL